MRKVKDAVDLTTGEKIYFKGHAKATYLSDGSSVEEAIINVKPIVTLNWETLKYNDVVEAYNSGKHVICVRGTSGYIYDLTRLADSEAVFSSFRDGAIYTLIMKNNNSGISSSIVPTTAVSDNPSNSCFPTEKAMCEYVQQEIENVGGESSVFEAVYGETTYDEIVAAVKAQKHVICFENDKVYNLNNFGEGLDLNFSCAGEVLHLIKCTTQNKWSSRPLYFEQTNYKVQSLSDKSTNTQYPSAKAVYDFVNTTLGTLINGDY